MINKNSIQFVLGNGYVGVSLTSQSQIQLISDIRVPFLSSGYSSIVRISSDTWEDSRATILNMKQGVARRIQCFKFSQERSAYVTHLLYAHRRRPSLIIQEIDIINPSEHNLDLNVHQTKLSLKHDFKLIDEEEVQFDSSTATFEIKTIQISARQHHTILCTIISTKISSNKRVKPGR